MPSQPDIVAAGAVVLRRGREVLLVHRPKYDDWSFPKGKLDRGEHLLACAVREVEEETGLSVRLGRPLASQRYPASGRMKTVHYWVARVIGDDDVTTYAPNHEIDQVRWVSLGEADRLLTYQHDRDTLREARKKRRRTTAFVVLRHAKARSRTRWRADDRFRPLLKEGAAQSDRLVPLLAAYDVTRLVSSSSARCVSSIVPYADATARKVRTEDSLSEEEATHEGVVAMVGQLVASEKRTVVCTHRPVLPIIFETLGIEHPDLEPAEMVVVHLRKGEALELERHRVR